MKITTIVVDDEPLARRRLRRLLQDHDDVEVTGEATNGEEAVTKVLEARPDLLFLDVRMPGKDGLQTVRTLHDRLPDDVRPLVVFTTAFEDHAVEAFELDGTDYLVKPVEREHLARALRRVRRIVWQRARHEALDDGEGEGRGAEGGGRSTRPGHAAAEGVGHLAAHRAGKIVRLALEQIACIDIDDTITWAHTPDGRVRLRQGIGELEERLPSPPFFRVSRSALVNLEWIDHLAPMFSGTYSAFLREPVEREVHVSRRRARELRELLGW